MKRHVTAQVWPANRPLGVKRTVITYQQGFDMLVARRQYATAQGYKLLVERPDGQVALYWDETGRLLRLALEPVE